MFAQRCTICLHILLDVFWQRRRVIQILQLCSKVFFVFLWGRGDPQERISGPNGHIHIDCTATQFVVVMPMM